MATLNLVPNPTVLAVQAGVFLANLIVVKKLLVEPYLTVRDRREALTVGSKDEAQKILGDCEKISLDMAARLSGAADEAKKEREKIRDAANVKRNAALTAAAAEAKKLVAEVEKQIQQDLVGEKAKVPAIVKSLTDEVYKLALA